MEPRPRRTGYNEDEELVPYSGYDDHQLDSPQPGIFGSFFRDWLGGTMMHGGSSTAMAGSLGGNSYSVQTFSFSSSLGTDGQLHVERYSSSEVGNRDRGTREAQNAYSNSTSGVEKVSLERQLGERGRKVVKERRRDAPLEERTTEMFKGMDENGADAFAKDFEAETPYMPRNMTVANRLLGLFAPPAVSSDIPAPSPALEDRTPEKHRWRLFGCW